MWHVTGDKQHMEEVNILSKFQILAYTVWELKCFEDLEEMDDLNL